METDYIKIFEGNFIIVQLVKTRLEDIGINPIIKDQNESGRLGGFVHDIPRIPEVFVHESEVKKAMQIVNNIRNATEA
ncbi:putative signal transducing protein [Olleya sp. R77988]|uniref:putative signal transducing protein n=1 Tax=Olleya sp. R77988 TaxID=3093875 RepID=UPI0037CAF594